MYRKVEEQIHQMQGAVEPLANKIVDLINTELDEFGVESSAELVDYVTDLLTDHIYTRECELEAILKELPAPPTDLQEHGTVCV